MATPTVAQRRLLAAGAKKASTWGTAVALSTASGCLLLDDGGLALKKAYSAARGADTPFFLDGDMTFSEAVDFNPSFDVRYDPGSIGTMIALLFGTAGSPTTQGTMAYKHTLQWADHVSGSFVTFCVERPSKILEVASAKIMGLDLSVADGMLRGTLNMRGNNVIDDSTTNTATQLDALTYQDRENRIKFVQGTVKMNAQTGADVTSETALQCSGFSISFKRAFDATHSAGSANIIEPLENDFPTISLTLQFPRMNSVNNAFFATFTGETEQKALIKFTGVVIAATYYYDLAFYFPRLRITNIEYPLDEIVPATMTLQAEEASANPTGMSYKRPYIELVNKQSTDYLA